MPYLRGYVFFQPLPPRRSTGATVTRALCDSTDEQRETSRGTRFRWRDRPKGTRHYRIRRKKKKSKERKNKKNRTLSVIQYTADTTLPVPEIILLSLLLHLYFIGFTWEKKKKALADRYRLGGRNHMDRVSPPSYREWPFSRFVREKKKNININKKIVITIYTRLGGRSSCITLRRIETHSVFFCFFRVAHWTK